MESASQADLTLAPANRQSEGRALDRRARLEELAQMLGTGGKAGAQGAEQLLKEAEAHKGK